MTRTPDAAIPPNWEWSTIGNVVEQRVDQSGAGRTNDFLYVDIGSIDTSRKKIVAAKTVLTSEAPSRARQNLKPGDVLVSMTRPNLNAVAIVPADYENAIGSTGFDILRTRFIEPRWLYYFVQTGRFVESMSMLVQGALYPAIRPKDIRSYRIPIAPKTEQFRIVEEIEKQFTRLDAAVAALKRVQANLKRYRAAVLKAACEGRLVPTEAELARRENRSYEPASVLLERVLTERRSRWEAGQRLTFEDSGRIPKDDEWKSKYQQPVSPAFPLLELPEGWGWGTLLQISWDANYGTSEKCDYEWPGPAVLRIPNVVNGKVDLADLKHANKSLEFNHADTVTTGDMLIVRTNGSRDLIGRSVVVQEPFSKPHLFASYLIRYRLVGEPGLLDWVRATWNNPQNRVRIESLAATTAGQYNVSLSKLNSLPIPLPPADEMQRVANEIDRRVSTIDKLENEVRVNLEKAGRLRQSILDQAFKGELVSQDPSDESARVLLERIRAEREVESRVSRKGAKEIVTR